MTEYLVRDDATAYVRNKGIPIGKAALSNKASADDGPKYYLINGRALYRREDLDAWVEREASVRPRQRGLPRLIERTS